MGILRFLSRRRAGKGVRLGENGEIFKPPKGTVECKIQLLDGTDMTVFVPKKAPAQELYEQVFYSLDLLEKDYFGLQYSDTYQVQHWLDPSKTIKKQMKIGPPYTLRLRVKFYALAPETLREELTRYQFFLQLKQDIQTGRLPCPFDSAVELAACILQSELGDYDPDQHNLETVSEFHFVPEQQQTEELEAAIFEAYKKLAGQTPAQVEMSYLRKARWVEMYGVDMHAVFGKDGKEYQLGLTPTGILVLEGPEKIGLFKWENILRLFFNKKKLTINVADQDEDGREFEHTFVFRLLNKKATKHLWKCAVEHHTFFRLKSVPQQSSARQNFFRMGSRFRYSGKTAAEAAHENHARRTVQFERRPSQRYSRRTSIRRPPIAASSSQQSSTAPVPISFVKEVSLDGNLRQSDVTANKAVSPTTKSATLPAQGKQTSVSVSSSSCEVISATILQLDTNSPPPLQPKTIDYKRSPSLMEIAMRDDFRAPLLSPTENSRKTEMVPADHSPPKPARSYTLLPTTASSIPIPSAFESMKCDLNARISDDMNQLKPRSVPVIDSPTGVTTEISSPVILDIPITVMTTFSSSSYDRSLPREINGFKLSNVDAIKPKESPKELVSILKNSDTSTLNGTLKQNGYRHPSSDSGRASPSSPSASPSPTSSALSAVSKLPTEPVELSEQEQEQPHIDTSDTVPLLAASSEEDLEKSVEIPLPQTETETAITLGQIDACTTALLIDFTEELWPGEPEGSCVEPNALLECASEEPFASAELALLITEQSTNGSTAVSRSGSGASATSNGIPEKSPNFTSASYQLPSWASSDNTKTLPLPHGNLSLKVEPERTIRRVITTEL